jgi:hypothetical protein
MRMILVKALILLCKNNNLLSVFGKLLRVVSVRQKTFGTLVNITISCKFVAKTTTRTLKLFREETVQRCKE